MHGKIDVVFNADGRPSDLSDEAIVDGRAEQGAARRGSEGLLRSLGREYHLLRLCRRRPQLYFFLTLDRARANLAMARYLLSDVERDIVV